MLRRRLLLYTLSIVGLAAPPAAAAVIGTTGSVVESGAPASTVLNALESDTSIFLFAEQQDVTLAADVAVDIVSPGTYSSLNPPSNGAGSVVGGSAIDSYFVHYDVTAPATVNVGSFTFDVPVLGILVRTATLEGGTDSALGAPGTTYIPVGGSNLRGMDFGNDVITLSPDGRTVDLRLQAGTNGVDQLRILTLADVLIPTPEPATGALLALGLVGLALGRRVQTR